QSAGATEPEPGEIHAPGGELAQQQRGDEEAGDHEEDVDAEKPARQGLGPQVEDQDRRDGEGSQAVEPLDPPATGSASLVGVRGTDRRSGRPGTSTVETLVLLRDHRRALQARPTVVHTLGRGADISAEAR